MTIYQVFLYIKKCLKRYYREISYLIICLCYDSHLSVCPRRGLLVSQKPKVEKGKIIPMPTRRKSEEKTNRIS